MPSNGSSSTNGTAELDEVWRRHHEKIDEKFEKSGKRSEIINRTRNQLNQTKWADEVQEKFEMFVKSKNWKESELTEETMAVACDALRDELRRSIPSNIKQDAMAYIADYVDEEMKEIKKEFKRRE
ncbi:hypothetical protein M3Y96_00118800 [Aphelenchoides besseyi]|nr:hypothetical protein M3Y96_00118800 [Aphelenchoides besseyi]